MGNVVDPDQIIGELRRYEHELSSILTRFTHSQDEIYIGRGDDPTFRQYVRELIDLFNDALGQNSYSRQIVGEFNDGVSNFTGSPSYKSVENILVVVRAALTRFTKNPELLVRKTPQTQPDVKEGAVANIPPRTGTLNERFESHPVVWGLTLLAIGFGAGFTARTYLLSETTSKPTSAPVNCRVEGADRLEETHHIRMEALQKQLMKLEAGASDRMLIRADQDKYKEAADRMRQDIATENSTYHAVIQQLSKKCQ